MRFACVGGSSAAEVIWTIDEFASPDVVARYRLGYADTLFTQIVRLHARIAGLVAVADLSLQNPASDDAVRELTDLEHERDHYRKELAELLTESVAIATS